MPTLLMARYMNAQCRAAPRTPPRYPQLCVAIISSAKKGDTVRSPRLAFIRVCVAAVVAAYVIHQTSAAPCISAAVPLRRCAATAEP
jgi:hypothetical protein